MNKEWVRFAINEHAVKGKPSLNSNDFGKNLNKYG